MPADTTTHVAAVNDEMAFWFALLVVLAVVVVAAAVGGWVLVGDITRLVRIAQWTEAGKRKDPGAVVVGVYADPDTNLNHVRSRAGAPSLPRPRDLGALAAGVFASSLGSHDADSG